MLMCAGAAIAPLDFFIKLPGEHFSAINVWLALALLVLVPVAWRQLPALLDWITLAFVTMLAFVALSTVVATPTAYKGVGLVSMRILFLNVLTFAVVRAYYAARPAGWNRFFLTLAASSVVVAAGLTYRAVAAGRAQYAVGLDSFALGLGTVAGTYTATFAAAAAGAIIFAATRRQHLVALMVFVVNGVTMVLALARGPWLAFALAVTLAVPVAAWRLGRQFSVSRTIARAIAVLLSLPVFFRTAMLASPFIAGLLVQRVVEVVNLESGTAFSRFVLWQAMLRDAARSPVFGRGAGSYRGISERLGPPGSVSENFIVEIVHAGGAVAVTFLLVGFIGVAAQCLLRPGASERPAYMAACLVGGTALVMGAMTNPAAWGGLFWVLLGIAATRPAAATRASVEPSTVG